MADDTSTYDVELNRVTLFGRLGLPPELRSTSAGTPVMNLRMSTCGHYTDRAQERHETLEWHSVVVWGQRALALAHELEDGSLVFVEGELHTSGYLAKDGIKRYKTEIIARNVVPCSRPPATRGQISETSQTEADEITIHVESNE